LAEPPRSAVALASAKLSRRFFFAKLFSCDSCVKEKSGRRVQKTLDLNKKVPIPYGIGTEKLKFRGTTRILTLIYNKANTLRDV
jgi:hypothetical protein